MSKIYTIQEELDLWKKECGALRDALKFKEKQIDDLFSLISRICEAGAEIVSGNPNESGDLK